MAWKLSPLPARALLAAIVWLAATAVNAADGPGLGNLSYSSGELFHEIGRVVSPDGQGNVAIVNGYLMVIYSSDGGGSSGDGGIEFWNVANPRSPQLHIGYDDANTHGLREPHGFGFSASYGMDVLVAQGEDGIQFWNITNPDAISLLAAMPLPGIEGGDYTGDWWLAVQAPYVYVAGVNQGLYVVDASNPASPVLVNQVPSGAIGGINPGVVWAIGNLLVVTRNANGGYATLDISDPVNPTLIATKPTGFRGYSHLFAAGKILTSGGDGGANTLGVHDVSADGTQITQVGQGPTTCGAGQSLQNGGYGSYQDGNFVSGFSNRMAVFNVATRQILGCGTAPIPNNDEDFGLFLGNLFWAGSDHEGGSTLMPHQTAPDTTGPSVTWIHPANGSAGHKLTTRVGVSMSSEIDLDSVNATTFVVRPAGGSALPGKYSVQRGIVNFSPDQPLQPNTSYEVVVDGLEDVVHNAGGSFSSSFTTGDFSPPTCTVAPLAAAEVGANASFDAATVTGPTPITYSWDFADGTPPTAPSPQSQATHAFPAAARYGVILTVANAYGSSSCSGVQIVHHPITTPRAVSSSAIVHDGQRSFNVNPDSDTVTAISEATLAALWEAPAGDDPRALAIAPDGKVWVVNRGSATLSVLDASSGALQNSIALPVASAPEAIAFAPNGNAAYVTLAATGRLLRLDAAGAITGSLDVGPHPRGLAISGDSSRILVTRFLSAPARLTDPGNPASIVLPEGEVREIDAASFAVVRTFPLHFDAGPDTEGSGRGVPNYLGAVVISPDGQRAVIPSKKDNVARGSFLDGEPLSFESRTRTILSEIDLVANVENEPARVDFNDRAMAQSVVFSPLGDLVFVAFQGSNLVEVRDANQPTLRLGSLPTGLAPEGLALDVDGLGRTLLYVQNFLSRSVSVLDVSALVAGTGNALTQLAEVPTVGAEPLSPAVLAGKRIFYNAHDNRMNRDGYLSCVGCHSDEGSDGQVWDFTQSGEGLRNTIDLFGRGGTGHGNVHWTANFDEIQDFENDIRLAFSGAGFLAEPDWLDTIDPLGLPKAGRSVELDQLAAYLASFTRFPRSPYRETNGGLTPDAVAGKSIFATAGCDSCHAGPQFRDGLRHDVGTIQLNSGQGRGLPLAGVGIDTPTLKGLWRSSPYLHNGAAASLAAVLDEPLHVGALTPLEKTDLVAYLLQIDDLENPACSNFVDDDADLLVDLDDPDCSGPADDTEAAPPVPACNDGIDDDGDALIDFPADPGCATLADVSENDPSLPCDDGADNDGDGGIDVAGDIGCHDPLWPTENPRCQNGVDDDADGKIDFDGGASRNGGIPLAPADPECAFAYRDFEKPPGTCGLGAEIALVLAGLQRLARRRALGARRANSSSAANATSAAPASPGSGTNS